MRFSCVRLPVAAALVALVAGDAGAQPAEKQRVATISGKRLAGGLVTGLAWDGGTLIIQTAAVENGEPKAHYFAVAAPGVELRSLDAVPASVENYWKKKGRPQESDRAWATITLVSGSKLPMYGIASQEKRLADAWDMGGAQIGARGAARRPRPPPSKRQPSLTTARCGRGRRRNSIASPTSTTRATCGSPARTAAVQSAC